MLQLMSFRSKLVSIDERQQQRSMKLFYERQAQKRKEANARKIKKMKKFTLVINPMFCLGFIVVYWVVGLNQYYKDISDL